ncbi:MAG: Xanthine and CO dehydrogenases maturation factor, XdhC/CoxF family [Candidatus Ozemobacter sibiricus]|jgi:xanthine dehydrogenase accessory factor|uniref:Xanthine and CO dehydrogenases maturation factor, XdhC/CoxF family n=1 Tax=Candidatus Ozemobacter sibiricus TaxID=2268124 RepID=A0A367ZSM9_9BACT|nr:MAG: Xanthine and CO dehydrogenases maturation factor, XdhC/CoxF family [Candidatus Ozemobacter sibiricus]
MSDVKSLFTGMIDEVAAGRPVAWCIVVETTGSTPQVPGAMMYVDAASQTHGTIGGGCVEAEMRRRAFDLLQRGASDLVEIVLDHDLGWDDGLICGGTMKIAVLTLSRIEQTLDLREALARLNRGETAETTIELAGVPSPCSYRVHFEPDPKLVIAGAGHIAQELARLAVGLGFQVTVVDNRADYAHPRRFPPPIALAVGEIDQTLATLPLDGATYVVIVTRGHKHDRTALEAVIRSSVRYLGMIGSERKVKMIFDQLMEKGIPAELIKRVRAPIGLSINAITVPEIAVSIAAQLIAARRERVEEMVTGPFPLAFSQNMKG